MFSDALRSAGAHPTRRSLLEALRHTTSFTGSGLVPSADPARKVPTGCYLIGRIENGVFQPLDDPPLSGPTHGFRCDQPYYYPP